MEAKLNTPVFVVGSPRSGTSILTWCLGHHPNFFPVPESNWLGDFAVNVAVAYEIGAGRGDYSILSAMDIRDDELFAAFGRTINELIIRHRADLEKKRETKCNELNLDRSWLEASSAVSGPKERWVDGTPEYSLHICGLRKLFPEALFIHVVRDIDSVVRSMLNFHRATGIQLVASEEEGYRYWIRTVRACLLAERAYGPAVVHRVRYVNLIDDPVSTMRSLLDFLGEPYAKRCLESLEVRINSSTVPPDFLIDEATISPLVLEEARRLSDEIEKSSQLSEASFAAVDEMQADFLERVARAARRGIAHQKPQRITEGSDASGLRSHTAPSENLAVADPSDAVLSKQPLR
jgi:Sulfotransferase family